MMLISYRAVFGKTLSKILCAAANPVLIPTASTSFWERDRKGGYKTQIKQLQKEMLKNGLGLIRQEFIKLGQEVKAKIENDQIYIVDHLDYLMFAKFDNRDVINSWVVTADKDHNEGKSEANFTLSKDNKGLFYGNISTDIPKDGVVKRSGYCSIRCPSRMKSFKQKIPYDYFADFSHLVIRCRGDGRPYLINIGLDMYFDLTWNDLFSYPLFTRGGPYWQTSKIPFSKFFRGSKGRIQDRQEKIILDKVANVGITCSDQHPGPFQLEIDYIMLLYDRYHTEQFAYESYETTKGIVQN